MVRHPDLSIAVPRARTELQSQQPLEPSELVEPKSPCTPPAGNKSAWAKRCPATPQTPAVSFQDVASQRQGKFDGGHAFNRSPALFSSPLAPLSEPYAPAHKMASPQPGFGLTATPQPTASWGLFVSPTQEGEEGHDNAPRTPPRQPAPCPSAAAMDQDWLCFPSAQHSFPPFNADLFSQWGNGELPWENHRPPPQPSPKMRDGFEPGDDLLQSTDPNDGRFRREFGDVVRIGGGEFGVVYRARHNVDQQMYAVKVQKETSVPAPKQEVFVLGTIAADGAQCQNLVRYFSSWVEDGYMHIQTELCEHSLRDCLSDRVEKSAIDPRFGGSELVQVISQVGNGLATIHRLGFAHLDIKPDNILVGRGNVYKIADFGLATASHSGRDDVSDGDCRYLAKELITGILQSLPQADVFSLGLVAYELATNPRPLPKHGDEWQRIRDGFLDRALLPELPAQLWELLSSMVSNIPAERPSSSDISLHPCISQRDEVSMLWEELRKSREAAEQSRQLAETFQAEAKMMKSKLAGLSGG